MARKISFDAPTERQSNSGEQGNRVTTMRPLLGLERQPQPTGALSAISRSLDGLSERAKRADEIEQRLVQGLTVVEIDPLLIDISFIPDRMDLSQAQNDSFRETIRENGQQSPILVRPKPGTEDRYEVAFGHRRLRAAQELSIKVRAVVKKLSDDELVIAQGQENSSRADLTYIERARFAARLEARGFSRDVIMSALGIDKAALSKLIALAIRLPWKLVDAIGPAPGIGRLRWAELADMLEVPGAVEKASHHMEESQLINADSNQRFAAVYAILRERAPPRPVNAILAVDGSTIGEFSRSGQKLLLTFNEKSLPEFGDFVRNKLDALYVEFKSRTSNTR